MTGHPDTRLFRCVGCGMWRYWPRNVAAPEPCPNCGYEAPR